MLGYGHVQRGSVGEVVVVVVSILMNVALYLLIGWVLARLFAGGR
jgi:hypothetical protein